MTSSLLSTMIRKLETHTSPLTGDQVAAVLSLPFTVREINAGHEIVSQDDAPQHCTLILSGLACRYEIVADGGRQIQSFHICGDLPDLHCLHFAHMEHTLGALRDCQVAFIAHSALRQVIEAHSAIGDALWRQTLVDSAIFSKWISNIGRRDSASRIAHLLCELLVRFRSMGIADDMTIPVRILQGEIADAQGMSAVHGNRSLRSLTRAKLIDVIDHKVRILDFGALASRGDFNPAYLHMRQIPRIGDY